MGKINTTLLPMKAHFFFFMAGMGPILPYAIVFGKQLGISEVVIGLITSILPFLFLLAKPVFGFFIDYFQSQRKTVFMSLLIMTTFFFALLKFVPVYRQPVITEAVPCSLSLCSNQTLITYYGCNVNSSNTSSSLKDICLKGNLTDDIICDIHCELHNPVNLYSSLTFWIFTLLIALGNIGYNVANSVSDAICFDMLGEGGQSNYGQQRVWGAAGFGIGALIGGLWVDYWSSDQTVKDYTPAIILAITFSAIDLLFCSKLKLPKIEKSEDIVKDILTLIRKPHIATFLMFAVCIGFCDSFIMFYLLWYLEDLAKAGGFMATIKTLQGLTIAAETLGGEIIFFFFSGRILNYLGYGHCLTLCFLAYGLRFALLSYLPSAWWVIPVELFMQGPSFALGYTTIVAYASAISPPGTSATMQGLVAGMDDGLGYIIGGVTGGCLYKWFGGGTAFKIYSVFAVCCSLTHCFLHQRYFKHIAILPATSKKQLNQENRAIYNPPCAAVEIVPMVT